MPPRGYPGVFLHYGSQYRQAFLDRALPAKAVDRRSRPTPEGGGSGRDRVRHQGRIGTGDACPRIRGGNSRAVGHRRRGVRQQRQATLVVARAETGIRVGGGSRPYDLVERDVDTGASGNGDCRATRRGVPTECLWAQTPGNTQSHAVHSGIVAPPPPAPIPRARQRASGLLPSRTRAVPCSRRLPMPVATPRRVARQSLDD